MEALALGEVQTRVAHFLSVRAAIKLEMKGLKLSRGMSALQVAKKSGYVPVGIARRNKALAHMDYVATLLLHGGFARQYGEEIVTGAITYSMTDTCGCPVYRATEDSRIISGDDVATMCIHEKG